MRLLLLVVFLYAAPMFAQDVVINKYRNGGDAQTGDGDLIELLVIRDHLSLQNYVIRDFAVSTNNTVLLDSITSGSGSFRFRSYDQWNDIRAGTLIVLRFGGNRFINYSDTTITVGLQNSLSFSQSGNFNIGARDMVMLKSPDTPIDGTQGNVHAFSAGLSIADVAGITPLLRTSDNASGSTPNALPDNRAGNITDYKGTSAGTVASAIFGSANNLANQRFLDSLRHFRTQPTSVQSEKNLTFMNIRIAPAPISNDCTVSFPMNASGTVEISLVDMRGHARQLYTAYHAVGEQSVRVSLVDVAQGAYFLVVKTGGGEWREKISVVR